MPSHPLWINGMWHDSHHLFTVTSPLSGQPLARVASATSEHVDLAIHAAAAAQPKWAACAASKRAAVLSQWSEILTEHHEQLARLIHQECGKVLTEAASEVTHGVSLLQWYAQRLVQEETDASVGMSESGCQLATISQPVGVVGCITPWNFPLASVLVKVGGALATGCACVLKPSEYTPLIALRVAELASVAQLPSGLLNVLPTADPAAVGAVLCQHPDVRMLSFTGSTAVGRALFAAAGQTVKRLALELGGNAPFIVFDDADIALAVDCAMNARFYNSGQICVGANRFLVHDAVYEPFAEALTERVKQLTAGPQADIGPLIHQAAVGRIEALIADALAQGAALRCGGTTGDLGLSYFAPTVLDGMTHAMRAASEEIFGPIVCLYRFSSDEEAFQVANNTEAGLAAYVFTQNAERLNHAANVLQAGAIGLNTSELFHLNLPFGGVKQSGIGKEQGLHCLDEFRVIKSIVKKEVS